MHSQSTSLCDYLLSSARRRRISTMTVLRSVTTRDNSPDTPVMPVAFNPGKGVRMKQHPEHPFRRKNHRRVFALSYTL